MAAVKNARGNRGASTRGRLLDAARHELMNNQGVVELAAVAKRAGVSPGLPYRYFESKSALIVAVVESFFDTLDDAAYRPVFDEVSDDWWEREQFRIERMVTFYYDEPLGPYIITQLAGDAQVVEAQHNRIVRQIRGASANVRTGKELGRVPHHIDHALAGALLMGGVSQAIRMGLSEEPRMPKSRVIKELKAFMRKVLEIEE